MIRGSVVAVDAGLGITPGLVARSIMHGTRCRRLQPWERSRSQHGSGLSIHDGSRGTLGGERPTRDSGTLVVGRRRAVIPWRGDGPHPPGDDRDASAQARSCRSPGIACCESRPLCRHGRLAGMSCEREWSVVERGKRRPETWCSWSRGASSGRIAGRAGSGGVMFQEPFPARTGAARVKPDPTAAAARRRRPGSSLPARPPA